MANWAYTENNIIIELHDQLPLNWRHISNLRLQYDNLEYLRSQGWLPVRNVSFDEQTHVVTGWQHNIVGDTVVATPELAIRPPAEPPSPVDPQQQILSSFGPTQRREIEIYINKIIQGLWFGSDARSMFEQSLRAVELANLDAASIDEVRGLRNRLLAHSDYTQALDIVDNRGVESNALWRQYRQRLRDLPSEWQRGTRRFPEPPTLEQ